MGIVLAFRTADISNRMQKAHSTAAAATDSCCGTTNRVGGRFSLPMPKDHAAYDVFCGNAKEMSPMSTKIFGTHRVIPVCSLRGQYRSIWVDIIIVGFDNL